MNEVRMRITMNENYDVENCDKRILINQTPNSRVTILDYKHLP